ncbi:protocadherin gamma-C5-like isoform X34 [Clupea harengus]|uniref:Protocadherin gamma-C5-like isoform X34 n=1 Tax=Clupea harengus TaxID=7950 RepID=A0A6P3W037_CLUHA|nr:protocadherin gamma-C5-like isoform X34 [Clupea harengus]
MEQRVWEAETSCRHRILYLFPILFLTAGAADFSYSVFEELTPGTYVGNITKDLGIEMRTINRRNPRVVAEPNSRYFDIHAANGALVVHQTIDRESLCGSRSPCSLRFKVLLQNPMEMHRVAVDIVDVNDNTPQFQTKNTTLEVSEAAAPGTRFRLECAQDLDVGVNSLHIYDLGPNDNFVLNVQTKSDGSKYPVLILNKPLDREKQDTFTLVLSAVDGGNPAKSGTTLIHMNVLDVNDNAPVFDHPVIRVSVFENSSTGALVTKINASDSDYGLNAEVSYLFDKYTPEDILKLFSVDSATGEIHVRGELDRELANVYDITIIARDRGTPAMEGSCNLKVEIMDVNDNTPTIVINSLSNVLKEDVESGTVIAVITVKDEDAGKNGELSVQIPQGLPFKLSPPFEEHYTLMTDGPLDRETVAEYTITVTATDSGSPSRSQKESFVLSLSDVNDNAPLFTQASYTVEIAENNAPNTPILTVSASDPDLGENGSLSFSILDTEVRGSPVSSYVYINAEQGHIYALRPLDHEQMNAFQIHVQVRDSGIPARISNATVHVFVLDENDHAPAVLYPALPTDGVLQLTLPLSAGMGHLVQRLVCVDGDSGHNAWLFYSLSGHDADFFHVGAHTGELRVARKLTQEEAGLVLSFAVLVQDNGKPAISTTVAVNVTLVEKVADVSSQRRSASSRKAHGSDVTLYLILSLSCVLVVSFLTFALLAVRWFRHRGQLSCLGYTFFSKHALHKHRHQDLQLQINMDGSMRYIEVVGDSQDAHKRTLGPCYSTLSSFSDFVFVKSPITGQNAVAVSLSKKLFANSVSKQKPPNDWRLQPNQRPGPSGAGPLPEGAGVVAGTGPWPNPPTEAEQLHVLMAGANVSEATATMGPRYNAQYVPDYRQNVYIPGSTATLTANPQQPPQQALPPPQVMPPTEAPKAAQTPASKKKSTKKDKK